MGIGEAWLGEGVRSLRFVVEGIGALSIVVGLVTSVIVALRPGRSFDAVRLTFARFLVIALELQLASDILSTAVAPSWDQIGKLAAVAVIRTALNFFLTREIREASPPKAER